MTQPPRYDPPAIEARWQKIWETRRSHLVDLDRAAHPYYNLMMFPYPSAEGLHVGNVFAFTGADIHGRWMRLLGKDVFEPIGFDAFGIHSENFALKVGTHPMDLIPRNVANFRVQLRQLGAMFDWDHEVDTTSPDYYRWTQWIFLKLYEADLAYKKEAAVNWCPACKTVLANEQVVQGSCERHPDQAVTQKFLPQWFFRITDYAQRLLDNLEWIDWSETTKAAQRNWIGRSEGAAIRFPLVGAADRSIEVFTTRPDTLFGATYMVLAPEHPLVDEITSDEQREAVDAYRRQVAELDLIARRSVEGRTKTGAFTGAYALNPATGAEIPLWIADYVLMDYGTGAIMAVPGHDERDHEFARRFGLPIVQVVQPEGELDMDIQEAAYTGEGRLINSGAFDGLTSAEGRRRITAWLGERGLGREHVTYRLHDWCISRQRYWGPPIPIIYCDDCGTVPVPEEDLPVLLPRLEDFRPDDSGVSPLARDAAFYRVPCPRCGRQARRETDVSDTFLDSAWYYFRYPCAREGERAWRRDRIDRWLPVDRYTGGNEHAVLHLLYTRFLTMVFHDLGLCSFEEPFKQFRAHGLLIKDGAKMSKSRGNVVNPDDYIRRWGADAFRTYLMFLGPYQEGGDFRDVGLAGVRRFLDRLWDTVMGVDLEADDGPAPEVERPLHRTIAKVTGDMERLAYNTAIAAMMEYLNALRSGERRARRSEVEPLIVMIAPFAPHLAEELWSHLGHPTPLFETACWPTYDPDKLVAEEVTFIVQVNGKVRAKLDLPRGASEEQVRAAAEATENVGRHLAGKTLRKAIFVPDKLLNLVVSG